MQETKDNNENFQNVILMTIYINEMIDKFEYLENAITEPTMIDMWQIISAKQMKQQFTLMHSHIEKSLLIPETNIFNLMQTESFMTKKNAIFVIRIPLVLNEKLDVFKSHSIPVITYHKLMRITNIKPYILANIDRTSFQLMNNDQLEACRKYDGTVMICDNDLKLETNTENHCAWNSLNSHEHGACEFEEVKS